MSCILLALLAVSGVWQRQQAGLADALGWLARQPAPPGAFPQPGRRRYPPAYTAR